jgi:phosphatidylserine/phosphatidylglycerophosphate/cardiolipin synthase-like enzyme
MIWRLRAADVFGRLRTLWPTTTSGHTIIVHSKVAVFDDRVVRVGSANLNNRSFGFDTELELAVDAGDDDDARVAIAAFRDRLVGHFMGVTGDAVAKARAEYGGLIHAIDALNRDSDRLKPIEPPQVTAFGAFVAHYHLGDPQDVADAWNPFRRRERLYRAVREMQVLAKPR